MTPASESAHPAGSVRWGLPDGLVVWIAGIVGVTLAAGVLRGHVDGGGVFFLLLFQQLPQLGALWGLSRWKGQRSARADFGLEVRIADAGAIWSGAALQIAFFVALIPLARLDPVVDAQQLLTELKETTSVVPVVFFALGAVVFAPLVEEGLYRGLLLRGLLRRLPPAAAVFVSAAIFSGVHYLGDPNALRSLPALAALGVILATVALRTGSLSRPILIHAGFNLTTTILVLTAGSSVS